jgi:hypothetical protein
MIGPESHLDPVMWAVLEAAAITVPLLVGDDTRDTKPIKR